MIIKPSALAAALSFLLPSFSCAAMPDMNLSVPFHALLDEASDNHYKLVEKEAHQALDLLKVLRNYAKDVSNHSEDLKNEMNDHHYNDMVDNRLRPLIHDAAALKESIHNISDREKDNVKKDLREAQTGDFGPITEDMARIDKFRADNQPKVVAVQDKIKDVEEAYALNWASARTALAQFQKMDPVPALLANDHKVKKIFLEAKALRPLQWQIVLQRKDSHDDDPRFADAGKLVVTVANDKQPITYPIVIR